MTVFLALAALALLFAGLVGMLAGLARWARHQRDIGVAARAGIHLHAERAHGLALAAGPGYLTTAEAEAAEETAADIARLAMVERAVMHRVNASVERALRQLLPPAERAWIRVQTGEFALVGVA